MRVSLLWCLWVAACSDGGGDPVGDVLPTVMITAPADGATVSGDVLVQVAITDFALTGKDAVARASGPGLWSLWMPSAAAHEVGEAPGGYVEFRLDDAIVAEVAATEATVPFADVSPGTHTLRVELLYPDADAFYPAIFDAITVTVDGG